ncbi:MAG: tetratricopeptide repeat protein [Opitutaceae bacterium]|nr:tetratricopeptide repeat protein [Opitutaceae bacterium]
MFPLRFYPWLLLGALPALAQTSDLELLYQDGASAYTKGDYDAAVKNFELIVKEAPPGPTLEGIYFAIANAKLAKKDYEGAVSAFGNYVRLYSAGEQAGDARIGATRALIAVGRTEDARRSLALLSGLRAGRSMIDNYGLVLNITLQLADELFKKDQRQEALELIQKAPSRDQILEFQKLRIDHLGKQLAAAEAAIVRAGNLGANARLTGPRDSLKGRLVEARSALQQVEENPTLDLPIRLRLARCYLELDRPWHAIVVFNDIIAQFPKETDRAYALHGLIYARRQLGQSDKTLELCEEFITLFPKHALYGEVTALAGDIAMRAGKVQRATEFFGMALDVPGAIDPKMRETVLYQLGDTYFKAANWKPARTAFDRFVKEYPASEFKESATYLSALSAFLAVDYESAEKALKLYASSYPDGEYKEDVAYRLAVCRFAYQEYAQTVSSCDKWEKLYPSGVLLGEVLSLKADALKVLEKTDDALETYLRIINVNPTDEVLEYALGEAASMLEKKRDWARMSSVFTGLLEKDSESSQSLRWTYWVSRAKARSGDIDGAAAFITARLAPRFVDAKADGVEQLINLLAQVVSRQKVVEGQPDALESFRRRLVESGVDFSDALPSARLKFFESRLLTLRRKPAESAALLLAIGRENEPQVLPVALLAECGDALMAAGDTERATAFYKALLQWFPDSPLRDYAYVGLGNVALSAGEIALALEQFDAAIDKAGGVNKYREATVGRARTLYELGRLEAAAKLFEQIAGTREWRGESTALSLHYLGLIAAQENDLPKAIAFYQRVFVSQGRYTEWVAKSYMESGAAFEKLGKKTEALATYREMVRNERMRDRPEVIKAIARITELERATAS